MTKQILRTEIILEFYKGMFTDQPIRVKGETFPLRKLKGLRNYRIGKLLFIEQNKAKKSKYAELAKKGAKIMWVINIKQDKYLFLVINGKLVRLS